MSVSELSQRMENDSEAHFPLILPVWWSFNLMLVYSGLMNFIPALGRAYLCRGDPLARGHISICISVSLHNSLGYPAKQEGSQ